jgi:Iron-containing redox enzyme
LVALQVDEYGGGTAGATHAELFARTMKAFDLDPSPGAYIDRVPGFTLATDNLVSLLGLHRRWRGALIGHLAAFEMTSVVPMSRYAQAVRKMLGGDDGAEFYDVHVEADVGHEAIATNELIPGLADSDLSALGDVPFGVAALLEVENRFTAHLINAWTQGDTSLRYSVEPLEPRIDNQFSLLSA